MFLITLLVCNTKFFCHFENKTYKGYYMCNNFTRPLSMYSDFPSGRILWSPVSICSLLLPQWGRSEVRFHTSIHWAREQWGDLSGIPLLKLYYCGGHCPPHVMIRSHLQDRLLCDFSFLLRRAQNPHVLESFLDDGGVLCGLSTLFLPDQSTILNHASLVVR